MDTAVDEEEEVHSFADDEEMEVKFSIDEADIPVPGPIETGANSRFLSSDLSASRSPRFSNPTMERQSSFKYRRSNRVAENYRSLEAPEVKVAMDPRQAHQSSYDEVETRIRTAPPTISLKKSGSPGTPKHSPRNSNRTAASSGLQATPLTPKSVPVPAVHAQHASPHVGDSPASNVTGPEESSVSVVSPASAATLASKRSTPHAPTRSPQPAPTRTSVTKRPVAEPSSANKRHSAIPTSQRAAFGGLAAKSPAPVVTPTSAAVVHKTVKPASSAKPTTELLSPIRARNFEEALKSAVSRSSTPTSLQRPRYSVDNLAIHAPATPTVSGKDWNGSVRVKKPNPNLEAQEHLDLLKRDSGEKALTRTGRRQPGGEGLTAHNLNNHRQNGENSSAFSHGSHQPGTPSSLFSPVSQRKYGEDRENGQRSVSSRSNTPTSLRPSSRPSSRPTSRSTTPINASAARRGPNATSLGQYFNTDEMTEISGHDSQAGDRLQRNAPSASGSLLSPYNLMVEGTHDRALDSASLSDKDLQSVAKQMLLLRLMLQAKNAADAEKEEADILHAWQVVHDAEEQAHLMASQDSGIEEISRTHQHILDMEKMVDELNDHLAPVFERLSAYRTLKEAQNTTSNATTTGTDADGTITPPPADPLLDAYSERAQAHKELQTRLAGLAKSIAALKKTVDRDGFVRPSEEALAMLSAAEQENAMSEEDSHQVTAGYRKAPAVNPVRVQASSAGAAPDAERSRSSSPAPTRRLSLVERQTLNREAMAAKNAQLREAEHAAAAPPAPPVRSKSPAVAARGGTTTFLVPAAARPTAASIAGTVRAKSPAPATAVAARSKSPAPAARAKSPGPASAGAAKRLNRAPAVAVSAVLEDAVGDGKQPRSVPRAKKPEPAVEPTPEPTKVPSVAEDVETAAEESVQGNAEDSDVIVENTTDPEVVAEDRASEVNASHVESVSVPVVSSEADKVEVLPAVKVDTSVEVAAPAALSAVFSDVEVAPVVGKEEATDAHLNSMFIPPVSPNSVDGAKNTVLPTPPLSPMTPGPSNTDAFNPALIAAAAPVATEPVTVNVDAESTVEASASPSKKAAFERLMKRLNSNKEGNSAGNSSRTSPVVTSAVSETNEVPAVASSAAGGTTAGVTVTTSADAGIAASSDEPITRRLSVAEMRAQFSGGAAKEPLRPAAVAAASAVASAVTPAVAPVVAPVSAPAVANTAAVNVSAAPDATTKDLTVDILSAEAVTVEYNDNSPVSQDGATASSSPFRRGEVKVPALPELSSSVAPSGVSPMKRVQSTRVSELMNKFGGSRKDVTPGATSPSPAAAPAAPAVTRNASVRGSIASITGINIKRSVFEKGELNTGSDVAEGEAGDASEAKSPNSANKRSKSPASLSRNGSSNNLAAAAGGSLSPKSPGSNPTSPVSKLASSLKSVLSFTKGSSSKNAAASADAAEEEISSLPVVASDSATTDASTNDAVKESMSPAVSEPLPVPATPSSKEAPPSYEESSVDVTPTNNFIKLTANTSVPAVPVEAGVGTPLSSRAPASARTPGTARTVILASPEQLPANLPFASSPSTVELLQAAASSESDGSLDWGVDGTYSHSLQVSRSEEFIHTANTFQPPLQTVTEADGEGEGEGEKEEDLTAVVSAQLTAQFQASKSSENVLAAMEMEAEQKEKVAPVAVAKQEPAAEVSVQAANGASEEEEEGLVLDFNTIETSIKASPTRHTVPAVKAPVVAVTAEPAAAAITTSTTTPVAVTTTATVIDDSKTNSPNDSNGNGAYSRVQSGRFSAVESDVSMSAPPTPLPATSFTNVTKVQHPSASISASVSGDGVEGEAEGDFNEGDFGADNDASETASNAGSTATNGSKKHRRPTLKGLWKRIGGSGKQKPGTEL